MLNGYVSLKWTGTVSGTVKLQGSGTDENWVDITGASATMTNAGSDGWNLNGQAYPKIRLVYTRTSGTPTFTIAEFTQKRRD